MLTMTKIEKPEIENLELAVRGGVGLGGFHGQAGDSFRDCVQYQYMIGGQWVAHPGNIYDYTVNIVKPEDPLVSGIGDFPIAPSSITCMSTPTTRCWRRRPLPASTMPGSTACDASRLEAPPWAGRVFYSSLGHQAAEFEVPQMREIVRRGLVWRRGEGVFLSLTYSKSALV